MNGDNNNEPRSLDWCWDYSVEFEPLLLGNSDLQLAAELGKTLLERNKDLETTLKQHQTVIEDQSQEIEYLTKQNVALREVNESRMKIYEQLEVSIQDLERTNHRLLLENSSGKKQIKQLKGMVESLEAKCDEFQSTVDELKAEIERLKPKQEDNHSFSSAKIEPEVDRPASPDSSIANHIKDESCIGIKKTEPIIEPTSTTAPERMQQDEEFDSEQVKELQANMQQMQANYERRIMELEDQLACVVRENSELGKELTQISCRGEEMKSMHEELTTLEEVRQGQMCSRCLRTVDREDIPEDDDSSMLEALRTPSQHRTSFRMEIQGGKWDVDPWPCNRDLFWTLYQSSASSASAATIATNFLSLLFEYISYIKDNYLVPLLRLPCRWPFLFIYYFDNKSKVQ